MLSEYFIVETIETPREGIEINRVRLIDESSKDLFLSLHIQNMRISNENFNKLRKLKILNILQPRNYYEEGNEKILIYPDLQEYKLNFKNLKANKYRILLQLALTYAELEKRESNWPLNSLSQLYYKNGLLYISLIEFDFFKSQPIQKPYSIFNNFAKNYFSNIIPDINDYLEQNDLKPIIEYLLKMNGELNKINYLNPPYENVLLYLLNNQEQSNIKLESIYEMGNSVVKGFETPNCLKSIFPKLCNQIVYKSSRFQSEEYRQQILLSIQREIELMEQCYDTEYVVSCFAYIRIYEYSFILQKQFVGTLADFLKKWYPKTRSEEQTIKDVIFITQRFALALKSLKKLNILHRDLKPENLFLDNDEFRQSYIYIADFDRSKQLDGQMGQMMTAQNVYNTAKYNPPETTQSFKYDNFQFGLIILTIANKGQYIGNYMTGPREFSEKEHNRHYSREAIAKALEHTKYDQVFLDVIAQCLKRNPNERPDIEEIYKKINPLFLKTKITVNSVSNPNNADSTPFSQSESLHLNNQPELHNFYNSQSENGSQYRGNTKKVVLIQRHPVEQGQDANFFNQNQNFMEYNQADQRQQQLPCYQYLNNNLVHQTSTPFEDSNSKNQKQQQPSSQQSQQSPLKKNDKIKLIKSHQLNSSEEISYNHSQSIQQQNINESQNNYNNQNVQPQHFQVTQNQQTQFQEQSQQRQLNNNYLDTPFEDSNSNYQKQQQSQSQQSPQKNPKIKFIKSHPIDHTFN